MGFLLLQYEYQRANRQTNLLTRTGIRLNNQIARYTKRIEKMESIFSKAQSRLDSRYSQLLNTANSQIATAQSGVSATGSDPAVAGQAAFANFNNALGSIVVGGIPLSSFVQIGGSVKISSSQDILTILSQAAAQAKTILATLIENAKEADSEKLQAQQDAQLEPISEKEGDLQAEQATNDALITLWEQRRDAAKEKLPDGIQNSMGHYGLK